MADFVKNFVNPDFVSPEGKDLCVICSAVIEYDTNTNIIARRYYIDGAGQLCVSCGKKGEEAQKPIFDYQEWS